MKIKLARLPPVSAGGSGSNTSLLSHSSSAVLGTLVSRRTKVINLGGQPAVGVVREITSFVGDFPHVLLGCIGFAHCEPKLKAFGRGAIATPSL